MTAADAVRGGDLRAWLAEHPRPSGAELAAAGYVAPHWPAPYGIGADPDGQLAVDEELAAAGISIPENQIGIGWAGPTILVAGTPEQQRRLLPPMLDGSEFWCQLFSEPGAGSDLSALTTSAVLDGDTWVVTGQKVWSTWADRSTWGILLARTDPDLPAHKGISYFVCPMDDPGVDVRPIREMSGGHHFNEAFLDEVRIPADLMIGERGDGWKLANVTLGNERVALSTGGVCWGMGPTSRDFFDLVRERGGVSDPIDRQRFASVYTEAVLLDLLGQRMLSDAVAGRLIDRLATGQGQLNRAAIDRYIRARASALTSHANIKSLEDPTAKPEAAKAMERATSELMAPMLVPPNAANAAFRREYVAKLIEVFKPIWSGNLHSRTMAMIVLSRTGDPQAVPVFIAQLNDPKQLAIVKLLSAVGITNVTQNGHRPLDSSQAIPAARALSDFLRREPETFWPAQFRAMEALGSIRLSAEQPTSAKAEFADTAMMFLTDSKAAPQVRAWAAWALGFMDVPASVKNYNFPLIALSMGRAAADFGTKISELPDGSMLRVVRFSNLLIQLHQGLTGDPEIRGSGLTRAAHPAAAGAQTVISEVEKRVRALTRAALDLSNAVGSQIAEKRKALVAALNDLKGYLAKPPAHAKSLYSGGPAFPDPPPPKVAAGVRP